MALRRALISWCSENPACHAVGSEVKVALVPGRLHSPTCRRVHMSTCPHTCQFVRLLAGWPYRVVRGLCLPGGAARLTFQLVQSETRARSRPGTDPLPSRGARSGPAGRLGADCPKLHPSSVPPLTGWLASLGSHSWPVPQRGARAEIGSFLCIHPSAGYSGCFSAKCDNTCPLDAAFSCSFSLDTKTGLLPARRRWRRRRRRRRR